MSGTAADAKYKATTSFGSGYTDPRGIFGNSASAGFPIFSLSPVLSDSEAVHAIDEATLLGLWRMKFPEPPNQAEINADSFYYALAHRWWNEAKLSKLITPRLEDGGDQVTYILNESRFHADSR